MKVFKSIGAVLSNIGSTFVNGDGKTKLSYLIFGLGAAVSGCLCGFGLACLMEKCLIVLLDKTNLYQFRIPHIIVLSDLALYVAFALIGL